MAQIQQREFQSKKLKRFFESINSILPSTLRRVHFILHHNGLLSIDFFDVDGIDITDAIVDIQYENDTLYMKILQEIRNLNAEIHANILYYFKIKTSTLKKTILSKGAFIRERNNMNLTINQVSQAANINLHIIYSMENGENKNYTIDTIFKYMLFFEKPLFLFISKEFKKRFVRIYADELANNNLITEQQRDNIISHYCPK